MKLLKVRLTKKTDTAPRKLMKVRCGDVLGENEIEKAFSNYVLAGVKPMKVNVSLHYGVHYQWRFPGLIIEVSGYPGEEKNYTPTDAIAYYRKVGTFGYDKDKYENCQSWKFTTIEGGKKLLQKWVEQFEQRLKKPENVDVTLNDFWRYFDKLKIHGHSCMGVSKTVSMSILRWEYPGLRLYAMYDSKTGQMAAKWEKRKLKGYQEDNYGETGSKNFKTLREGGTILLQFAKQFEQRLDRPVKVLKRPQKSWQELDEMQETFDKMFGRGSKYFNDYGGHYASYAQNARSAWDYLGGDIVLVLGDKGGMVLETAFGDVVRFKAGDFDGVKRRLEKFLKEYGDDE